MKKVMGRTSRGLAWVIGCCLMACTSSPKPQAKIRIGQFLIGVREAVVRVSGEAVDSSFALSYGELTDYVSMPSGKYQIEVQASGHAILRKQVGLGAAGKYSMCLFGIAKDDQTVNQETVMKQLLTVVEGEAARSENGFLPQLFIQNDFYVHNQPKSSVRLVHFLPGTLGVKGELLQKGEQQVSFAKWSYPKATDVQTLEPGGYELKVELENGPTVIADMPVTLEQNKLHTFYLIPGTKTYLNKPMIVAGVTEVAK